MNRVKNNQRLDANLNEMAFRKMGVAVITLMVSSLVVGLSGCGDSQQSSVSGNAEVSTQSVSVSASSPTKKTQKVVRYTLKKAGLYKKASKESKRLATLTIATKISGTDNGTGWVKTKRGKTTGYVASSVLGSKKEATAAKKEAAKKAAAKKAAEEKARKEAAAKRAAAKKAAEKKAAAKRKAEQKKAAEKAALAGAVSWKDCGDHIGEQVRVYGKVVETKYASASNGGPTFLDIGAHYGDNRRVTVLIWEENRGNFSSRPESYYYGKKIVVSGYVDVYAGACQIEVTSPSQITVL